MDPLQMLEVEEVKRRVIEEVKRDIKLMVEKVVNDIESGRRVEDVLSELGFGIVE